MSAKKKQYKYLCEKGVNDKSICGKKIQPKDILKWIAFEGLNQESATGIETVIKPTITIKGTKASLSPNSLKKMISNIQGVNGDIKFTATSFPHKAPEGHQGVIYAGGQKWYILGEKMKALIGNAGKQMAVFYHENDTWFFQPWDQNEPLSRAVPVRLYGEDFQGILPKDFPGACRDKIQKESPVVDTEPPKKEESPEISNSVTGEMQQLTIDISRSYGLVERNNIPVILPQSPNLEQLKDFSEKVKILEQSIVSSSPQALAEHFFNQVKGTRHEQSYSKDFCDPVRVDVNDIEKTILEIRKKSNVEFLKQENLIVYPKRIQSNDLNRLDFIATSLFVPTLLGDNDGAVFAFSLELINTLKDLCSVTHRDIGINVFGKEERWEMVRRILSGRTTNLGDYKMYSYLANAMNVNFLIPIQWSQSWCDRRSKGYDPINSQSIYWFTGQQKTKEADTTVGVI